MTDKNNKLLWITWEIQRRNRSLSRELSAKLIEIDCNKHRLIRYIVSIYRTLSSIRHYKPDILFVQNPSIVLAIVAIIYHKITNLPVVVDAHNAGISPTDNNHSILNKLTKLILIHTPLTIVTNNNLAKYVTSVGGHAIVLPDPLPEISDNNSHQKLKGSFNVLFICSWAEDEPYKNVIEAARLLDDDTVIYITSDSKGKEKTLGPLPENVILTGYLNEVDFISMLFGCDLILDLTTRDDCLVCGAYEGLAVNSPMLLSDTAALQEYFKDSAIYTDNTAQNIADKISFASEQIPQLKIQSIKTKKEITYGWQRQFIDFRAILKQL